MQARERNAVSLRAGLGPVRHGPADSCGRCGSGCASGVCTSACERGTAEEARGCRLRLTAKSNAETQRSAENAEKTIACFTGGVFDSPPVFVFSAFSALLCVS